MRRTNKYKLFNSLTFSLKKFPLRILKFHRSKWIRLQKSLSRNLKKKSYARFLVNVHGIKNSPKTWEKVKRYFKKGFLYKNLLYTLFDKSVVFHSLKNKARFDVLKKDFIETYLIKTEFRIDILLFNLNFFDSIYQAKQCINSKNVFVNGKFIKPNTVLSKGDIITFNSSIFNRSFNSVAKKYSTYEKFFTFLEIDYYTKTIVVIKDPHTLTEEDLYLLTTEYLNVKTLSYNL